MFSASLLSDNHAIPDFDNCSFSAYVMNSNGTMYTPSLLSQGETNATFYMQYQLLSNSIEVFLVNGSRHYKQQIFIDTTTHSTYDTTVPQILVEEGDMVYI